MAPRGSKSGSAGFAKINKSRGPSKKYWASAARAENAAKKAALAAVPF